MKKIVFLLCALVLFSSCNIKKEKEIVLDNSDPLALAVDVQWALVTDPYATFKTDREWNSSDRGHAKKGEVLKVIGISLSSEKEKWIRFNEGYLPEKSVKVFSNKYQAEKAARDLN